MPAVQPPEWRGRTVCCIASGPSLTREDCDAVRAAGLPTVVTNTSFRMAPWADVLFAFDLRWWLAHLHEVKYSTFKGRLVCASPIAEKNGIESIAYLSWFRQFANSGASAVSFAVSAGASKIILLGFDCQRANDGRMHWHPDHPKGMSNGASIKKWPVQFKALAAYCAAQRVRVVNCTRETALGTFERASLQSELDKTAVLQTEAA